MKPVDAATIKSVVIPAEHGASVMLAESLVAGLLIGASINGIIPALGWIFVFFMSQPLKITIKDLSHRIFTSRTETAVWCAIVFGIMALCAFVWSLILSGGSLLFVFAGVVIIGMAHLWAVVKGNKKEFAAELFGALTLGAGAASIILATGHIWQQAFLVWGILAIRAGTSVVYVRERLRLLRSGDDHLGAVVSVHVLSYIVLCGLVSLHLLKPIIVLAGFLFAVRIWYMYQRIHVSAKILGIQESVLGLLYVVLVVLSQ